MSEAPLAATESAPPGIPALRVDGLVARWVNAVAAALPPSAARARAARPAELSGVEPELRARAPRSAPWTTYDGQSHPLRAMLSRAEVARGWVVSRVTTAGAGFEGSDTVYWLAWEDRAGVRVASWRDTSDAAHGHADETRRQSLALQLGSAVTLLLRPAPDQAVLPYPAVAPWLHAPLQDLLDAFGDTAPAREALFTEALYTLLHEDRPALAAFCQEEEQPVRGWDLRSLRDDGVYPLREHYGEDPPRFVLERLAAHTRERPIGLWAPGWA